MDRLGKLIGAGSIVPRRAAGRKGRRRASRCRAGKPTPTLSPGLLRRRPPTRWGRRAAAADPLWYVAVVTEALGPAPSRLAVRGADLLSDWNLDPVTWRVPPRSGA
jgi:hypothetical protein